MMAALVRRSFSAAEPVAEAGDLATAHALIETANRTQDGGYLLLMLADLHLPDGRATELMTADALRQCRKVIFTLHADDRHIFDALRSGADGYLLKTEPLDRLVNALQGLAIGHPALSPQVAQRLLIDFRRRHALGDQEDSVAATNGSQALDALSSRETQVLRLLSQGMTIAEVSDRLQIRWFTVNDHVKAIYRKLGVASRAEAAVIAARRGWV